MCNSKLQRYVATIETVQRQRAVLDDINNIIKEWDNPCNPATSDTVLCEISYTLQHYYESIEKDGV